MNSPHKGQWRGALMFSLIWTWTNGWVNNRDAGDLRCHRAHYDITAIKSYFGFTIDTTYFILADDLFRVYCEDLGENSPCYNGTSLYWECILLIQSGAIIIWSRTSYHIQHCNRPISQVPQCIRQISHNAPFCNRNVHTCAHFCYKMVHYGIWDRSIMGFVRLVHGSSWA